MERLWKIFKSRQDIENAFVLFLLSGLMLLTSVFVMSGEEQGIAWEGFLISGMLLTVFLTTGTYFFVAMDGHKLNSSSKKRKP